ncbi:MAG: DUF5752 family protein [Thermodesulfobacteriota bacterium]|nr:DUF5752 family protein [Thermodesulfobacteriota bacterium]
MKSHRSDIEPFWVKDCALIAIATGKKAQNLRELREYLRDIDTNSIYYHFWGGLLRPRFDDPEYHNDFAIWVAHSLHHISLAERLAIIDPTNFETLEDLRSELINLIEDSLDETEFPKWAKRDDQFEYIRFQLVIFNTNISFGNPYEFSCLLPQVSLGSIFFHFIDSRHRNSNHIDDFRNWLLHFGEEYKNLINRIERIDPYFSSLAKLRHDLSQAFSDCVQGEGY